MKHHTQACEYASKQILCWFQVALHLLFNAPFCLMQPFENLTHGTLSKCTFVNHNLLMLVNVEWAIYVVTTLCSWCWLVFGFVLLEILWFVSAPFCNIVLSYFASPGAVFVILVSCDMWHTFKTHSHAVSAGVTMGSNKTVWFYSTGDNDTIFRLGWVLIHVTGELF